MLIRCPCCLPAHFHSHRSRAFFLGWSWFSLLRFCRVDVAQLCYTGTLVIIQCVTVLVQRDGRIGVAQEPGERYHVHSLLQGAGCKSVAQRMKICIRDTGLPHTPLEQVLIHCSSH